MTTERMTRRRFLAKAAAAAGGLAALGLGVQCGGTPTPEVAEVAATETPAWEAPERILFIGNSLSYWNDGMETHLTQLAASAEPPLTIETSTAYISGATFERHWKSSSTLDAIREGGRDVVVLQGFLTSEADEEGFYEHARKLDEEIEKVGAHTVFFMPWAMKDQTRRVTLATEIQERAYEKIAAQLGARVAPVGLAWQRSIQENADLDLYDDGVHPSIHGTYLAACVFYAVLFGESPVGLSYKPPPWMTDEERIFLQRIAWETVQEYEQPAAD